MNELVSAVMEFLDVAENSVVVNLKEYKKLLEVLYKGKRVQTKNGSLLSATVTSIDKDNLTLTYSDLSTLIAPRRSLYFVREAEPVKPPEPIPMIINCPECGYRHIDSKGWETKVHCTHACQKCGFVWRPAVIPSQSKR